MPPGMNGYIFASLYDRAVGTAANAVLIGTSLSVGTITVWLALLAAWT
jgi:predicted permease